MYQAALLPFSVWDGKPETCLKVTMRLWTTGFYVKHVQIAYCWNSLTSDADFGLSYAKGGELLDYIHKLGSFDEKCTQFYTAEIVLALEHLHGLGIIHR